MIIEKTERYSDELLGFVITCLYCEAIDISELQSWCAGFLGAEGAPDFLYDLIEFDEPIFKIYKVIGYVPNWSHSKNEEYALYGIALLRGTVPIRYAAFGCRNVGRASPVASDTAYVS